MEPDYQKVSEGDGMDPREIGEGNWDNLYFPEQI
jgi:hypothetical protein